jgi:hypothetical protein
MLLKKEHHAIIHELPQEKKTGYFACAMEEAMEGNDCKESFLKLTEESLKTLSKDSTISVLQLCGKELHQIFALYKAGESWKRLRCK